MMSLLANLELGRALNSANLIGLFASLFLALIVITSRANKRSLARIANVVLETCPQLPEAWRQPALFPRPRPRMTLAMGMPWRLR